MSDTKDSSVNSDDASAADERLADVLDQYVDSLHADDVGSRTQSLQRHPELRDLMGCLDSLELLAPPYGPDDVAPNSPTLLSSKAGPEPHAGDSSLIQPELTPGECFGRYELIRELGRGGMGVVFLARQVDLDREVAVKMILSSRLASPDDVRRFLAESKAAGRMRHPNIVAIHEAGEVVGQHYFAMDYVDGPSLAEWRKSADITPEQAAECVAAVAGAVQYLHEQGIVHRDLKPSNILLDSSGKPHVTDFGLARVFNADSRDTQTGTILGTPSYMPPEQAAGKLDEISPRSDVYSLGAILYELLTGEPPFHRANPLDALVDVLEGEPDPPRKLNPNVPRELQLVCLKCLEKDPDRRYATARDLAEDLQRFLRQEPVAARPSSIWQWLRRWGRRQPALVSRLGGLLAAYVIVQGRYIYDAIYYEHPHSIEYYVRIIAALGLWAAASFVFQRLLEREQTENAARYGWAVLDGILLTTVLCLADDPRGMLMIGYPLLVAASGLFFRVRLVLFTTAVCLGGFSVLLLLRPEEIGHAHYPVIYGAVLAVIGFVVSYQVHRVRALSRYYDRRHVP